MGGRYGMTRHILPRVPDAARAAREAPVVSVRPPAPPAPESPRVPAPSPAPGNVARAKGRRGRKHAK